ncbi:MAG: hypothetical protein WA919_15485 [Coleofasciculaceae cyanobacterium]
MTDSQQPEDVTAYNESSLKTLVRIIRLAQGQFRLILARCNYLALRDRLVQRLGELSPVQIREIVLPESVKYLYNTIQAELGDEMPPALMVLGLESVSDLRTVLTSSHYIREEFSKSFPFPLILWVNDQVFQQLLRLTPDLESWATSVEFQLTTDELFYFLRQKVKQLFSDDFAINKNDCSELEAACKALQNQGQELESEFKAGLEFCRGLGKFTNNQIDEALEYYQKSLELCKQSNQLYQQGILLLNIALSLYKKAENNRASSQVFWQKSKNYFYQCLKIFAQTGHLELVAKYTSILGEVLRHLKAWKQLKVLVKKSYKLHYNYGKLNQVAQDYSFLAEVALAESDWIRANKIAQLALQTLAKIPEAQHQEQSLYLFLLARSQQHLQQPEEVINNLEKALEKSNPQHNPQLHIDILGNLSFLYFQQGKYLKAFEIKQEKRSIEYQYGFQAFAGASQLQPTQQLTSPTLAQTAQQAIVSQEIAASGREEFVKRLIARISSNHHKLTVIHGQSGVGKSSIVQAGLVPALKHQPIGERDALTVVLRVYNDWVRSLVKCLAESFEEARTKILPATTHSTEVIIKQLRKNADYNLLTVIIFDQFEEFFFVYKEPAKRRQFYEFLGACLNIPFVKVILSLREDYLHYLLECNRLNHLDAINHNILDKDILFYLGNFSRSEATLVIENLTTRSQFYLEPDLIDELVKDLAVEFDSVRPIELQVVGAQIQESQITTLGKYQGLGNNPKEVLVKQYLEGVIKDCGKENEKISRLVLYGLTDENLTRPLKTCTELLKDLASAGLKVETDKLDLVLKILVGSGLVVRVPESPDDRYQLVHDYLVAFIRQQEGAEVEELRKEVEFQRRRADEFMLGQSDALIRYSETLFNQGKKLEALIEGLRAGIPLKQVDRTKVDIDTWSKIVTVLQQEIYEIQEINCLEGHDATVNSVIFSPDGKTIASASGDWTIKLWNREGKLLDTLQSHHAIVNSINFSPDGKMIASASVDGTIKLWNSKGELLCTFHGHHIAVYSVSFSPDGKTIAFGGRSKLIKLWSIEGELLHICKGHEDAVNSVSFSPDGKMIASGSKDRTIKLWNSEGKLLHTLQSHNAVVCSVSFSPDGKMIASASWDGTIKLWSIKGELLHTLPGNYVAVNNISFSPDGKIIISANGDGTFKMWSIEGELLHIFRGHEDAVNSVSFSPDGKVIASGSRDKTIKLWSYEGQFPHTLQDHEDAVNSVSFSPDGKIIASGSKDKTIKLWSYEGRLLKTLRESYYAIYSVSFSSDGQTIASASGDGTIRLWSSEGQLLQILKGHSAVVNSVSFSPDGKMIASGSRDQTIHLWSIEGLLLRIFQGHEAAVNSVSFSSDGQAIASASWDGTIKLWNLKGKLFKTLRGHDLTVNSVSFSPDNKIIASGSRDRSIKLWSIEGELLHTLQGHEATVNSVGFSPDGKTIISASKDRKIKLWSCEGELFDTLQGHEAAVNDVSFSPDGKTIASASEDKKIKLWSRGGKLLDTLQRNNYMVNNISFSPDGKTIASASRNGKIKIWNREGQLLHTLKGHKATVNDVNFSPDGKTIASGGGDWTIKLWDGEKQLSYAIQWHNYDVNSVSFSPDGKTLASASRDRTIKVWNRKGQLLHTLLGHKATVNSASFSPDGKMIVSASGDKTVKIWNKEGQLLHTLEGHNYEVNSASSSPDGRTIISASGDGIIKIWNKEGQLLHTLEGHNYGVNSISFSPNGKTIASASEDQTIKLWNREYQLLHTFKGHEAAVKSIRFSPDGKIIASVSRDGKVILWNLDLDDLLMQGCNWVRNYLKNNPNVRESDRHLCDGISTEK